MSAFGQYMQHAEVMSRVALPQNFCQMLSAKRWINQELLQANLKTKAFDLNSKMLDSVGKQTRPRLIVDNFMVDINQLVQKKRYSRKVAQHSSYFEFTFISKIK